MSTPYNFPLDYLTQVIGQASNIVRGTNPTYTNTDFLAFYPVFTASMPTGIIDQFILIANQAVLEARWHESWRYGMANFIAHLCTLYLQVEAPGPSASAGAVVAAAEGGGLKTSKGVGDLSVGYDYSLLTNATNGWGDFNGTIYGRRFANMAKMLAKAGSYVW